MCIYYRNQEGLDYSSQEHVLPAALGCHTKLPKGAVSDQANKYFSPIERRVIDQSLIQIPRIIQGPGKRGSLSPSKATTSDVSVVTHSGSQCLGYMKGIAPFILNQYSFKFENDSITELLYHQGNNEDLDVDRNNAHKNAMELQERIRKWDGNKFVPVRMDSDLTFITYFKDKIYIGSKEDITEPQINFIKSFFAKDFKHGDSLKVLKGNPEIKLEVKHSFVDVAKIAAKVAVNTLAYIAGADAVLKARDLDEIIGMILADYDSTLKDDDSILGRSRPLRDAEELKRQCYLEKDCQACLLYKMGPKLIAYVFFYNISYAVELSYDSNLDICRILGIDLGLDGIVCDWKNQKDYRYINYLIATGRTSK